MSLTPGFSRVDTTSRKCQHCQQDLTSEQLVHGLYQTICLPDRQIRVCYPCVKKILTTWAKGFDEIRELT